MREGGKKREVGEKESGVRIKEREKGLKVKGEGRLKREERLE